MTRIIHTADWQIGLKASHVARVGDSVRKARMDSARAVVQAAHAEGADALVLAGDIFEDNLVDNSLVHEVVRILAASKVPVYVLPGNHDPLSQDSIYRRASWGERPAHVHLLATTAPVEIAGGAALLLPAPLSLKASEDDPTLALQVPANGARPICIGVAHGSLKIEGKYKRHDFPIALDAPERLGLSYLALGHWHGRYVHGNRMAYSGTLETTKFGEDGSGLALVVDLVSSGPPVIRELRTGKLRWITRDLDLTAGGDVVLTELRRELAALEASPESLKNTLLRLRTTGQSTAEAQLALKRLEEEIAPMLLYFELDRRDIPSHVAQGKLSELAVAHPFVAGLIESLADTGTPVEGVSVADLIAARRLLTDLLLRDEQ